MKPSHLRDFIFEYQNSHDCSDDDMVRILCDAIESNANEAVIEGIKDSLDDHEG